MKTSKYLVIDESSGESEELLAATLDEAVEEGEAWLREGWEHEAVYDTIFVHGRVENADDPCEQESIHLSIYPEEPDCPSEAGEHNWQAPIEIVGGIEENPGVWGHGGGVVIDRVCMRCGLRRCKNTWATDPETGMQGLETISYSHDE